MTDDRKPEKIEFDADEMIRDYEESAVNEDEAHQTTMEWYEQANQDTPVPPEAVLTGGDIDAAWDQAAAGEETVGGSSPTPDQDLVDEIGRAVGLNYEDAEPLHTTEKIERRDQERWELHPASSEDFEERSHTPDTPPASTKNAAARSKRPADSTGKGQRKAAECPTTAGGEGQAVPARTDGQVSNASRRSNPSYVAQLWAAAYPLGRRHIPCGPTNN